MRQSWFVKNGEEEFGPIAFEALSELVAKGKLQPTRLLRPFGDADQHRGDGGDGGGALGYSLWNVPESVVWQQAGTIKGLFGRDNSQQFRFASEQMKNGDPTALRNAALALTEIIDAPGSSAYDERRAMWKRGTCQQQVAWKTDDLGQVVTLFQSARRDFSQAVKLHAHWYARKMAAKRWFPENPIFIPAYIEVLASWNDLIVVKAAQALGRMGRGATEAIPALEAASVFSSDGCPQLRQQIPPQIQRIATGRHDLDEAQILWSRVEAEFDRTDWGYYTDNRLTEDDLNRPEAELVALLADKDWVIRAKSACIIRCKVDAPKPATLQALFEHIGPAERRGEVRGQCALTLEHFAPTTNCEMLGQFVSALLGSLEQDATYRVKAIAAKALARIGNNLPEVIASLVSCFSKPQKSRLQTALVEALGECGEAAKEALPLILPFTPHPPRRHRRSHQSGSDLSHSSLGPSGIPQGAGGNCQGFEVGSTNIPSDGGDQGRLLYPNEWAASEKNARGTITLRRVGRNSLHLGTSPD